MTNSLNTPIEALEFAYPVRMIRYAYRQHSGGGGRFRGGDGLIRELQLLADADVTLLADRRDRGPYGLSAGEPGSVGSATAALPGALPVVLPGKSSQHLPAGTILHIETPGGGGWGEPPDSPEKNSAAKPDS
jgi:N-methylhydantoinase B